MKFWAYFVAKIGVAGAFLYAVWLLMTRLLPEPGSMFDYRLGRLQDLRWTSALLLFWLLSVAIFYLIVWDQQRRCRICLRRLRMPVELGYWSMATIFSPPRTESICPYGHGTLEEPEVQITGRVPPSWRKHGDIWAELERRDERG